MKKIVRILNFFGFSARKFLSIRHIFRYLSDLRAFRKLGGTTSHHRPMLTDFSASAGSTLGHYFTQDLHVATLIHRANPDDHVDIGSRIDGFVAHVASFRTIKVLDIRPLALGSTSRIVFLQHDLMSSTSLPQSDSVSCLHTIEHFGLGRYNDPLDPNGHIKGIKNIIRLVKPNGKLYISFPIGNNNEVHFNAHRVFKPTDILEWGPTKESLSLERFDYIDDDGKLITNAQPSSVENTIKFGCGMYVFRKI